VVPGEFYVPLNLAMAAIVFAVARTVTTPAAMGFKEWARGARWGLAVVAIGFGCYLVALASPLLNGLFSDSRVSGGAATLFYETFVRIPLGTVVLEEVAFRAALPAVFTLWMTPLRAVVLSSLLFGFWHVLPSLQLGAVNPVLGGMLGEGVLGTLAGVAFAVAGTFLAGLWLCFLRYRSGSVLAPLIAHVGSNSIAYAMAWFVGGGVGGNFDLG